MERTKQVAQFITKESFEEIMLERLSTSAHLTVHKSLIAQYGGIGALIISYYLDKHFYFKTLYHDFNGWFCLTYETQVKELEIPFHTIKKWKDYFVENKILSTKTQGMPSKLYFKINFKNINFYGKD